MTKSRFTQIYGINDYEKLVNEHNPEFKVNLALQHLKLILEKELANPKSELVS